MSSFFKRSNQWWMPASSAAAVTGGVALAYHLHQRQSVHASAEVVHAPHYPWEHHSPFKSYDHASIRRGYQVYKEVCSACHSLEYLHYRDLVGVSHTLEEAKAEAAEIEVEDGPDDTGEMFKRPGRLADNFPKPYKNPEQARFANNGAVPPDLSCIIKGRENGENYVFSLLTGYTEPPAGVTIRGALHYNKYFPGGAIAMARNLYDGVVEYEDGTPNHASQLAKDVVHFLTWASDPVHDERKQSAPKALFLAGSLAALLFYLKRHRFTYLKSRKFVYKVPSDSTLKPSDVKPPSHH